MYIGKMCKLFELEINSFYFELSNALFFDAIGGKDLVGLISDKDACGKYLTVWNAQRIQNSFLRMHVFRVILRFKNTGPS